MAPGAGAVAVAVDVAAVPADPDIPPVPACLQQTQALPQGIARLGLRVGTESITPAQWGVALGLLPEAEALKVRRFYHDKDRRLALGSLLLQRAASSWVLGKPFGGVAIERAQPHNKPYVDATGTRLPGWNYNVSHHGEWVVLACEPVGAVGTDVVDVTDRPFDAMTATEYLSHFQRHLTPAEWDGLTDLAAKGEAGQYRAFHRIWAMKEAYIKALGLGLSFPIHRLECNVVDVGADMAGLPHAARAGMDELMMDGYGMPDWKLRFFFLPPSYLWCSAVGPAPLPLPSAPDVSAPTSNPCGPCFPPAASLHPKAAAPPAVPTTLASAQVQEQLRSEFHLLTIRDCLPFSAQAAWDAACLAAATELGKEDAH